MDSVVYFHTNKLTGEIFYVGMGLLKRAYNFAARNRRWKNYVNKYGFPNVVIVHKNIDQTTAFIIEQMYVSLFGRKGFEKEGVLLNLAIGGSVGPRGHKPWNKGAKLSNSIKTNMREAAKNRFNPMYYGRNKSAASERMKANNPMKNKEIAIKCNSNRKPASLVVKRKISERSKAAHERGCFNHLKKSIIKIDTNGNEVQRFDSIRDACKQGDYDRAAIKRVINGKTKTHKGYYWKYA